ncbi:N-alpha-acetyltransferase 16, auxiliary subunit [Lecanosticta acicola]|uniref:N-alpha-acetyltransferase 16, auxiliary subunit n=1 Tax=Lecanosticta acicola TaxID=111012 RepID=A0AAI8YWT3_9PEZI|nr:N-alpha-acetyltransferase 16, auxiliary subunit [Lecanosticta acicola]
MAVQLPSKEQSLFRHLVQYYESKQYKKGLKAADQILRKHPNHGDTQAMKALILNNQGKQDEAFELCKLALKNSMKSHICWHVYGLLYRSVKNYEEAIKAYRFALKLDPESQQIQRDLALLQVQMRDYPGFVQSRNQMLQARPALRQNWTALAVALHLNGELEKAEDILQRYEETLKQTPPRSDIEHSEAVLYKNSIIAEAGEIERALEHLNAVYKTALDRTAVMELKADYLLRLDRKEEAAKAYRALLDRNAERRAYFEGLEKALGRDRGKAEDQEKLRELYQSYADKNKRADAARRIPLDFLHGEAFREQADSYLRRMFLKGVPSTFANVKQLYSDAEKLEIIQQLVEGYVSEGSQANGGAERSEPNGSADGSHKANGDLKATNWALAVNYFLAQHYSYHISRDLAKAQQYSDKAISLNPSKTDYTYQMTRARILKHRGDTQAASNAMNDAREMDLKDRYINTKCAKYQLRNDENQAAIDTMGLFTRKEAVGGPLGDLLDMQCVWFITEDGESYLRQGKLNLALKRFKAVYDIFDVWQEDQFDFHTFSLRKGMIRAYIDMVRWEDKLREHPFFTRAALSAIGVYLSLYDKPELKSASSNGAAGGNSAEAKKAAKKARKEAEKAEAERKAAAAKKPQPKADEEGNVKKEDPDPQGLELLKTETPLGEAMKYLSPLLELSPNNVDGQIAGFEVYMRRKKYLPALRCLLALRKLNPHHPKCHELGGRFKLAIDHLPEPLPKQTQDVLQELYLSKLSPKSLEQVNEEYLESHKASAPHVQSVVRFRNFLKPGAEENKSRGAKELLATIDLPSTSLQDAVEGARILDELKADKQPYLEAARNRWPEATVLKA